MQVSDFSVGERVRHQLNGAGVVVAIERDRSGQQCVVVEYDKIDRNGRPWRGAYCNLWFGLYSLQKVTT